MYLGFLTRRDFGDDLILQLHFSDEKLRPKELKPLAQRQLAI